MKKIISVLLCVSLVLGTFSVFVFAEDKPFYSLTFNANGGKLFDGNEEKVYYLQEGDPVSDIVEPTKTANNFLGWDKTIPEKMPAENLVFTAKWEAIPGVDPQDGLIPIEKAELNIDINRVYADAVLSDCLIEGNVPEDAKYNFTEHLEKNINGEWTKDFVKSYSEDKIGAGEYRWRIEFNAKYDFKEYKIANGKTEVFINGKSVGFYEDGIYTDPFTVTEKDLKPEPIVIEKIVVTGFKEPKDGQPLTNLNKIDIETKGCEFDFSFPAWVVMDLHGESAIIWEFLLGEEELIANKNYLFMLVIEPVAINQYYKISSNPKLIINGHEYSHLENGRLGYDFKNDHFILRFIPYTDTYSSVSNEINLFWFFFKLFFNLTKQFFTKSFSA